MVATTLRAFPGMSMTANVGTLSYTPPEVMSSKRAIYDGRKWDVYSASLCLYYMYTSQKPFANKSNFEIISGVANENGLRPDWLDCEMPNELWLLLVSMWDENPDNRPLCDQVSATLSAIRRNVEGSSSSQSNHATSLEAEDRHRESESVPMSESEWTAHHDATHGATFYHHTKTRRTTWTNPMTE